MTVQHSEQIDQLATALSKAQGVMTGAAKDSANPFFKSKYADLESVWTACRKALSDNGLAVVQSVTGDDERAIVTTMLTHASGQWIRDSLPLKPKANDPQGIGSAITYGRRYALAAMVGVYQTDDDGEAAHGRASNESAQSATVHPKVQTALEEVRLALALDAPEEDKAQAVRVWHEKANKSSDFYLACWDRLTSKERSAIKAYVEQSKPQAAVGANGRRVSA